MSPDTSIGPGTFVAVVGPSGAGKDSVMREGMALVTWPMVQARRVITRPADIDSEDHDTLNDAAFMAAELAGAFALSWSAHGHRYAIPVSVDDTIRAGGVVIANLSRAVLPAMRRRYRHSLAVLITARPEIIAERLTQRGREDEAQIAARLKRMVETETDIPGALHIDNSADLASAARSFADGLQARIHQSALA